MSKYEVHPKGQVKMRTFRLSEKEHDLLRDCMAFRGYTIENQYIRGVMRQEWEVFGDPALLQAVRDENPVQCGMFEHRAPRSWSNLHAQLVAMVRVELTHGKTPPPWALALAGGPVEFPPIEPPPLLCCRNPNPELLGVGILCSTCQSSLPPAAAAQAALWRAKRAATLNNPELRIVYERLAARLEAWAEREEAEPELRALRLQFTQSPGTCGRPTKEGDACNLRFGHADDCRGPLRHEKVRRDEMVDVLVWAIEQYLKKMGSGTDEAIRAEMASTLERPFGRNEFEVALARGESFGFWHRKDSAPNEFVVGPVSIPPPSSTKPKADLIWRPARLRGDETVVHVMHADSGLSICGVRLLDDDVEVTNGRKCWNCTRMLQLNNEGLGVAA